MFSLLSIMSPACLITSCRDKDNDTGEIQDISVKVDSCIFSLRLDIKSEMSDSPPQVKSLDLLVYDEGSLGTLESWTRFESLPDSVFIKGARRSKTVVAIANSPRSFSRRAIDRYDSIELLSYEFDEDSPETPIMSGVCGLSPDRAGRVTLVPLMSRVRLGEISNTMKAYVRLEDPRVYLENMNACAEIIRSSGFRPSDFMDAYQKQALPYDIGIFAQRPGTELFCYPNETPEGTVGALQTIFVLECEISGNTCRFPVTLNSLGRNKTLTVDISVAGPEQYDYKVY